MTEFLRRREESVVMVVPAKAEILRHRDSCQRLLLFAYRPVHSPRTAFDPLAPISFT